MSTAKFKARRTAVPLKTDESDEDLMIFSAQSLTGSNYELDWSYTARCTKELSADELLSHLCSQAFTIPPRDYNPSAPFVYIRTEDGVITTLPHGYRIPLMFIAKYQWETTTRTLSLQNRQRWEAVRDEIFHLSRLCHVFFSKARAKAESSGMEKGWRCVMFDRVLTRFYKGWPVSSPAKLDAFISHFSSKEYEKDVLKYDWKRWALKGFFRPSSSPTIHLTEENVNDGITAGDLKMRLSKIDNVWTLRTSNNLKRLPITFMQPMDGSSSKLTDFDLSDEDSEITTRNANLNLHPPFVTETPTKRTRETPEDDDAKNRSGKRAKLEEIVRSISSLPCTPIVPSDGPRSGDASDKDHDPLPKFKVPRQILHSYGWQPLSAMDGVARRLQREEQGEEEEETEVRTDVLPACGLGDASTSIPPSPSPTSSTTLVHHPPTPSDEPMNDSSNTNPSSSSSIGPNKNGFNALLRSVIQTNASPTSPNLTTSSSKSKGKQPESASTNTTSTTITTPTGNASRNPRNSAYVSLPSSSRITKPPARPPGLITIPPPPDLSSSPMTRRRRVGKGDTTHKNGVTFEDLCSGWLDLPSHADMNKKEEGKVTKKSVVEETRTSDVRHSGPSSSLPTNAAFPSTEDGSDFDVLKSWGLSPRGERTRPISCSSCSSSLSSLSSSATPPASGPLAGVDVIADASAGNGTQQLKGRIRELKTRFVGFRDDLERIIGRLEVVEGGGGEDVVVYGDRSLGQGSVDGGSSEFVSQASQTGNKGKLKDKGNDLDIEMMGISQSGAIPGHVDTAVGDSSVVLRDVSVQTDEPPITVRTVGVSSAIPLHAMDGLAKKKIKPTLSKTDESFPPTQYSSLSTMVDSLVSNKMLSMMQTLVKSSIGGSGNGELVESSTTTADSANTGTTKDSDITGQTSPSPTSLFISAGNHSMDPYDIMSNLLEELKTIKEEARCRDQSEKEDLLAMRQLHSAEVDALRRRLSYLESGNMSGIIGRQWDTNSGGRWKGSSRVVDDSLESDRHHHRFFEDSSGGTTHHLFRQQQYGDRSQHLQRNGLSRQSSSSTSTVNPEGEQPRMNNNSTTTPLSRKLNPLSLPLLSVSSSTGVADSSANTSLPTPTPPTPSDRHYSFGYSKKDVDDDNQLPLPLPVKSQRKHHMMALARAHFS